METLIKIQKELKAPKSQKNTFGNYNYRSCEDILEAVKPLLGKAILTLNDEIVVIGTRYYVKATATITDGEKSLSVCAYARESEEKKGMDTAQVTGASSSYARKYALNGLFCIDDTKEADATNNGNGNDNGYITKEQLSQLVDFCSELNIDMAKFVAYLKVDTLDKLPKAKYQTALNAIEIRRKAISKKAGAK